MSTSKTLSRRSAIALVGVAAIATSAAASVMPASSLPIGELSYPELAEEFAAVFERWRVMQAEAQTELNDFFDEDEIAEINHAADTVSEKVLALPARSLADLALKARAAALINFPVWTGEEPYDITTAAMRWLVDDLCRLAGVEVLPGVDIVANELCEQD